MNPVIYVPQSKRLLEQLCEVLRYKHYSFKTEQAYCYWVRFFVRWCGRVGPMRHPRDMGAAEVTQFLTMLANERRVSVSTHNQALSALLFLYRDVLGIDLPWLAEHAAPDPAKAHSIGLDRRPRWRPCLGTMEGETALLGKLLYGTGMRLMEGLRLRVKDVDFDRQVLIVREAKGGKDRVVMLPKSLQEALKAQDGARACRLVA
jgi:integrase